MTKLQLVIADALDISLEEVLPSLQFKNHPSWDSLAALSLLTSIEDEFGVILSGSDFVILSTVSDLSEMITARS